MFKHIHIVWKDVLPSHFPWKVWVILCLLQATSSDYVVNDLACAYVPMEADHTLMGNLIQWIWYHMKQLVVWIKAFRRCKVVARPHCETMIPSEQNYEVPPVMKAKHIENSENNAG